jgi:cbb3-type cytochrome oxidase subunit 1
MYEKLVRGKIRILVIMLTKLRVKSARNLSNLYKNNKQWLEIELNTQLLLLHVCQLAYHLKFFQNILKDRKIKELKVY